MQSEHTAFAVDVHGVEMYSFLTTFLSLSTHTLRHVLHVV